MKLILVVPFSVVLLSACSGEPPRCKSDEVYIKGECLERRGEGRTQAPQVSAPPTAEKEEKAPESASEGHTEGSKDEEEANDKEPRDKGHDPERGWEKEDFPGKEKDRPKGEKGKAQGKGCK